MKPHFSWRALLVTLLLAALALGAAWVFPTWRMPGEISLAHAAYESQCDKCHTPWQGINVDGCLQCHPAIGADMASAQSVHKADQRQCDLCHVEHRGRNVYIVPTTRGIALQDSCVNCHTNEHLLEAVLTAAQTESGNNPPAKKNNLVVDVPDLASSPHGQLTCADCHGGNPGALAKTGAHEGLIADPSADPGRGCGKPGCHATKAARFVTSLHFTAQGLADSIPARSDPALLPKLREGIAQCTNCHAACGQCHVSHPKWNDPQGLQDQHRFVHQASMDKVNCGDCHSPSDDYLGNIEGNQPDVHWTQAKMTCMDCHSEATVHGVEPGGSNANAAPATRSCESCHPEAVSGHSDIRQHDLHYDKVACWVCHAQSYQNCYDCHVQRKDTGELSRKPGRVEMGFKIGRLPGTNAQGQPLYGLVNHVPVTRDSYAILGDNLLPHFDDVPTWKPTTPHNILRRTKQNARCEACHESGDLWLQSSDLEPGDAKANLSVVVEPPHPRDKYQEP